MLYEGTAAAASSRPPPPPPADAPRFKVLIGNAAIGSGLVRPYTYYPVQITHDGGPAPTFRGVSWLASSRTLRRYSEMVKLYQYILLKHTNVIVPKLPQKTSLGNLMTTMVDDKQLKNQQRALFRFVDGVLRQPQLLQDVNIQRYLQWPRDDSDVREARGGGGATGFPEAQRAVNDACGTEELPTPSTDNSAGTAGGWVRWAWKAGSAAIGAGSAAPTQPSQLPLDVARAKEALVRTRQSYVDTVGDLQRVTASATQLLELVKTSAAASIEAIEAFKNGVALFPSDENLAREAQGIDTMLATSPLETGLAEKISLLIDTLELHDLWWQGAIDTIDTHIARCEVQRKPLPTVDFVNSQFDDFRKRLQLALDEALVNTFKGIGAAADAARAPLGASAVGGSE